MSGYILAAFILAAFFDSLNQLIILDREGESWLPGLWGKVFKWSLPWPATFDAWHTYQSLGWTLGALGGVLVGFSISYGSVPLWGLVPIWIGYYQVRNVFLHIVNIKFKYWRFPIFRAALGLEEPGRLPIYIPK